MTLLGRQLGIGNTLRDAYNDATNKSFGYLIVDLSPKSDEKYKLRTNVFPDEAPLVLYQ